MNPQQVCLVFSTRFCYDTTLKKWHRKWCEGGKRKEFGWKNCCVSIHGLHPLKDPASEVFEGESFRETLLNAPTVVKWDGLDFGAFPGCIKRFFTLMSRFCNWPSDDPLKDADPELRHSKCLAFSTPPLLQLVSSLIGCGPLRGSPTQPHTQLVLYLVDT